ncbi:MAG: aldose 1-epimerase family protein [Flavobacteriales bacterium]|nr:aldose 1-epimerase family protein [Flavobacteriales bacterium]
MQHIISNSQLQVSVLSKGTEISSIQSLKTGTEYMWNADPAFWGSHAPVLFPAIGSFKDGECSINGEIYRIPKHGFIRHNEDISLCQSTATALHFQLEYSEKTLAMFPFKFRFHISFELHENKLTISHKVENLDDKDIHFSLGAHPAFNCPIHEGEEYSDYYIEFEENETAARTLLSSNGLITDKTELVLKDTKTLPLHSDLFNDDALIFKKLKSRRVSLKSKKFKQTISLNFSDFKYLGIWAKPNAPFVCIEPWLGIADHENTDGNYLKKDGLITLPQAQSFSAEYSVEIEE